MSKQLLLQRTASLIALMIWHGFLPMSGADALDFSGWSKDCMHQNAGQIEMISSGGPQRLGVVWFGWEFCCASLWFIG